MRPSSASAVTMKQKLRDHLPIEQARFNIPAVCFHASLLIVALLATCGNGLPSPESTASSSPSRAGAAAAGVDGEDGPGSRSPSASDGFGDPGSSAASRLRALVHRVGSGNKGRMSHFRGTDDGSPSSEDEFVEQLEKLLRSGGFRDRQRVYHGPQSSSPSASHSAPALPSRLLNRLPAAAAAAGGGGVDEEAGGPARRPYPAVLPSTSASVLMALGSSSRPTEGKGVDQGAEAAEVARADDAPKNGKKDEVAADEASKTKPFAYKPNEKGFWQENEESAQQMLESVDVQSAKPSAAVATDGDRRDDSGNVRRSPETEHGKQRVHHLRELPVPPEYHLAHRAAEDPPPASMLQLRRQQQQQDQDQDQEIDIDVADPLHHIHPETSAPAAAAGAPSGHDLPMKRLRPDDFLTPTAAGSANPASKSGGQKEIVTYIDIPKMLSVEEISGNIAAAVAAAGHMKKDDDDDDEGSSLAAAPAAAGSPENSLAKFIQPTSGKSAAGNADDNGIEEMKKVEETDLRLAKNIEELNKMISAAGSSKAKTAQAHSAGVQLDVGDHKTHWLQSTPGKKAADIRPADGQTKDEKEAMRGASGGRGNNGGWKQGVEDDNDVEEVKARNGGAPGPQALRYAQHSTSGGNKRKDDPMSHFYFIGAIAGCSAAVAFGVVAAGVFWMRLKKNAKAAEDTEYPAYGVTGPGKHGGSQDVSPTSGDRKLAQSAQMYHYQHQKQQMIAMENHGNISRRHGSTSDVEESDEEENEEGDYTVYECPGLAPTGEMEVRNPLFQDDPLTPGSPRREVVEDDDPVQP